MICSASTSSQRAYLAVLKHPLPHTTTHTPTHTVGEECPAHSEGKQTGPITCTQAPCCHHALCGADAVQVQLCTLQPPSCVVWCRRHEGVVWVQGAPTLQQASLRHGVGSHHSHAQAPGEGQHAPLVLQQHQALGPSVGVHSGVGFAAKVRGWDLGVGLVVPRVQQAQPHAQGEDPSEGRVHGGHGGEVEGRGVGEGAPRVRPLG